MAKKKNRYGNPLKNIQAQQQKELEQEEKQAAKEITEKKREKSLIARLFVIALCAVMVLGLVVSAAMMS